MYYISMLLLLYYLIEFAIQAAVDMTQNNHTVVSYSTYRSLVIRTRRSFSIDKGQRWLSLHYISFIWSKWRMEQKKLNHPWIMDTKSPPPCFDGGRFHFLLFHIAKAKGRQGHAMSVSTLTFPFRDISIPVLFAKIVGFPKHQRSKEHAHSKGLWKDVDESSFPLAWIHYCLMPSIAKCWGTTLATTHDATLDVADGRTERSAGY